MRSGLLVNAKLTATSFIWQTTFITKISCSLLIFFYLLSFAVDVKEILAITPGHLILPNFWIWTLFTHQLIETNLFSLASNLITILFSVKFLESIWGIKGFLIFFSIITASTGLATFFVYLFIYMSTFDISYLFDVHVYGLHSYVGGVLVCFKQSRGDQMVIGSIGLNVKNLPFLYSFILILSKIFGLIPAPPLIMTLFGIFISWIYLRFYQSHIKGRGDQASHFAFKTFFPKALQGPVGALSNFVFKLLLTLRICRKTSYRYDVGAPSKLTISLSDSFDAERRRNKAIKALDERLQTQEKQNTEETEWPLLDEPEASQEQKPFEDQLKEPSTTTSSQNLSESVTIDIESTPDSQI